MGYILSKYKLLCPGIKRVVIATAFFACITFRAEAQQSCYDASQNVIYTNPFLRVGNAFVAPISHSTVCASGSTTSTTFYKPQGTGTIQCTIVTSIGIGGSILATGVLRDYTIVNCPLDDYLPYLFIGISALTVYYLKKGRFTEKIS
jgi:hypothetical protein